MLDWLLTRVATAATATLRFVDTNTETSSVFTTNANVTGPWPDAQLTNSGKNVFAYIAKRYPLTMSQ